jgi:hypothetical protein
MEEEKWGRDTRRAPIGKKKNEEEAKGILYCMCEQWGKSEETLPRVIEMRREGTYRSDLKKYGRGKYKLKRRERRLCSLSYLTTAIYLLGAIYPSLLTLRKKRVHVHTVQ